MPVKRRHPICLFLLCLICCAPVAHAWNPPAYTPLPTALDGSMMPYDFSVCNVPTYMPDSLKPVAVTYVARHGARYLSGPKKTESVMMHLTDARNNGTLSDTGENFLKLMELIIATNSSNWGDLSQVGVEEQIRLGSRMAQDIPAIKTPGARINAVSSHVPRVVMTMYQFLHRLTRINDLCTARTDEGTQFDPLLCCFIADSAYANYRDKGNWRPVYQQFVNSNIPTAPARRLFTATKLSDKQLRKLTVDMYEVLKANRAYGLPAPTTQWMSEKGYRACWQADNLRHYLRNSITPLSDLAGKAAAPLLQCMIIDADRTLQGYTSGEPYNTINAYFGHCETLLPLLSLIGIPRLPAEYLPKSSSDEKIPSKPLCTAKPAYTAKDFSSLHDYWKIQDLSPLGANIVIIFAQAPSGTFYVTMQLNGRTVNPLCGYTDILPWSALRDHWLSLLP